MFLPGGRSLLLLGPFRELHLAHGLIELLEVSLGRFVVGSGNAGADDEYDSGANEEINHLGVPLAVVRRDGRFGAVLQPLRGDLSDFEIAVLRVNRIRIFAPRPENRQLPFGSQPLGIGERPRDAEGALWTENDAGAAAFGVVFEEYGQRKQAPLAVIYFNVALGISDQPLGKLKARGEFVDRHRLVGILAHFLGWFFFRWLFLS